MMSSNGACTPRLLWENLFTFRDCSTYLSENIGSYPELQALMSTLINTNNKEKPMHKLSV